MANCPICNEPRCPSCDCCGEPTCWAQAAHHRLMAEEQERHNAFAGDECDYCGMATCQCPDPDLERELRRDNEGY